MKRLFQKEFFWCCLHCLSAGAVAAVEGTHVMHRVRALKKYGVSATGARRGILFPSLHLNFLQHDLCCLCRGCVLPPSPPQSLSEKEWVDGRAALWGHADAVAVKALQCTLVCSSVSCLWESRAVCVYDPGSHCEGLKSILVKLVSDWVQKKQEKMQDSLAHKANSVLTPGWEMVIPALNSSQVLFPQSLAPSGKQGTSHNHSFPLSYSLYLAFWATFNVTKVLITKTTPSVPFPAPKFNFHSHYQGFNLETFYPCSLTWKK